jgi:hypothetical protein
MHTTRAQLSIWSVASELKQRVVRVGQQLKQNLRSVLTFFGDDTLLVHPKL